MGLAASQARFLAITARKTDCELKSTQLAQDKLSVTNELTEATEQYQSSLNATKLIWDTDGSGLNMYEVSYDLLMTPSALNMYDPYLVTDPSGRIALDTRLAAAAKAAKIDPKGGTTATEAGRTEFINALVTAGAITGSTGATILENAYSESAGVGGLPLDKTAAYAVSNETLANYLSDETAYSLKTNLEKCISDMGQGWGEKKGGFNIAVNGQPLSSQDSATSLTLGDLLQNDYTLVCSGGDNQDVNPGSGIYEKFVQTVFGCNPDDSIPDLSDNSNSLFGQIATILTNLLGIDDASLKALDFAYNKIMQDYTKSNRAVSAGNPKSTSSSYDSANSKANE